MKGLYSCIIAISMYSRLPMPKVEWRKERMAYVMCCFPIVGLLEGAALALWFWLGMKLFRFTALFTALAGAAGDRGDSHGRLPGYHGRPPLLWRQRA